MVSPDYGVPRLMPDYKFHHGDGIVTLKIPDANVAAVIRPWHSSQGGGNASLVADALGCAEAAAFTSMTAGKKVCVLVDDGTRQEPLEDVLKPLVPIMKKASQVMFMVCTGTHDAETPENHRIESKIRKASTDAKLESVKVHVHDCRQDTMAEAGRTSRDTRVLYNKLVDGANLVALYADGDKI